MQLDVFEFDSAHPRAAEHALLRTMLDEYVALAESVEVFYEPNASLERKLSKLFFVDGLAWKDTSTGRTIWNGPVQALPGFATALQERDVDATSRLRELQIGRGRTDEQNVRFERVYFQMRLWMTLFESILRSKAVLDSADLAPWLDHVLQQPGFERNPDLVTSLPLSAFIARVRRVREAGALTESFVVALGRLVGALRSLSSEHQRLATDLETAMGGDRTVPLAPDTAWTRRALEHIAAMPASKAAPWIEVLQLGCDLSGAKPNAKWIAALDALLPRLGDEFVPRVFEWLTLADDPTDRARVMPPVASDVLRGMVWALARANPPELGRALVPVASGAYRKVPSFGPRALKVGNACIAVLGGLEGTEAVGHLAVLKSRVKLANAQKEIGKALDASAERLGIPRAEVEELAVPTCGLERVGALDLVLGDARAELRVRGTHAVELAWFRADGRPLKSVPAAVRAQHAEELAELKLAVKDLELLLPAQRERLDTLYLDPRTWDLASWRARYLDHPLVGTIARRLVWSFTEGGATVTAVFHADGFVDAQGRRIEPSADARVALWHPIDARVDDVLAWRERLALLGIVQPFKQAHREVYALTDAERRTRVYSNRFAAHVLKQHVFHALCLTRGWQNKLRLMVDDFAPPATRALPASDLRVEYWIEALGTEFERDTNTAGTFHYVTTDQVRFYRLDTRASSAHAGGGGYTTAAGVDPLPLDTIPPLVLSEILRDVDLFVGVASVGNDPTWGDRGTDQPTDVYWRAWSFGELSATAKTRKAVLEALVPKLAIADRCRFEDRWIVVRGDLRTYKVHLGSGNILMLPDDRYLCIVPDARAEQGDVERVFLPFEGDRTLSIVLSKAMLLAADAAITDETILRQIRG